MDIRKLDVSEITFSDPDPMNDEFHLCPTKMPNGDTIKLHIDHQFTIIDVKDSSISLNMDNKEVVKILKAFKMFVSIKYLTILKIGLRTMLVTMM